MNGLVSSMLLPATWTCDLRALKGIMALISEMGDRFFIFCEESVPVTLIDVIIDCLLG